MRRLAITSLVTCLLMVAASPSILASSPQPSPLAGEQRVESTQHGFVVTFPGDWDVREGSEDWPTTTGRRIYTSVIPIFRQLLVADGPPHPGTREQCEVQSFAYPELTPFDIAYSLWRISCDDALDLARVSLPAGEAVQLNCQDRREERWFYQSWYVMEADPGYVWLWCRSADYRPDDHWRSIADTIEWLPEAE